MADTTQARTLDDWLQWQTCQHSQQIQLGLERVHTVAEAMGVQRPAPLVITIAGTNGKGSSAALLEQTLLAAGYRTGVYTSPHLLRYNERLRINGREVTDAAFCAAFEAVERARVDVPLTYFEYGTLAAFSIIQAEKPDIAILEVGLGGRLDAVNIVDADVALITNIGLDHQDWLGSTREKIAIEKAGIMRPARPVLCNDVNAPRNIASEAQRIRARHYNLGAHYHYQQSNEHWSWQGMGLEFTDLPMPSRMDKAAVHNAAGVLAVLAQLPERYAWQRKHFESALRTWHLPGRREWREVKGIPLLLDVSHNAEAVEQLAKALLAHTGAGRHCRGLFAALGDKPVKQMLGQMSAAVDTWYLAGLDDTPRGMTALQLQEEADELGLATETYADIGQAWQQLCDDLSDDEVALVFGSFHTVEAVMRLLDNNHAAQADAEKSGAAR